MSQKVEVEISARLDALERELGKVGGMVQRTTGQIESSFAGISGSLGGIASGLVAAFSVDAFAGIVRGAIDAQDKLGDLSKTTSLSVETLAGLGAAARKSGSNLDDVAGAINKLSVNMGKEPEKFRQIGISAKDPIEAFKQLADVFKAIQDPQERAAFGAAALGKSWAGSAPLLMEGGKAIGEMVEKGTKLSGITAESAKAADEFNDRWEDIKIRSEGVKTAIVNNMIDPLSQLLGIIERYQAGKGFFDTLWGDITNPFGSHRIGYDKNFASIDLQVEELSEKLTKLKTKKAELESSSGGWINEFLIGGNLPEINRDLEITKNQLEALTKFKDKIKNPSSGSTEAATKAPDVRKFLDGAEKSTNAQAISEGERLIQQLKDRLATTQQLSEVERLESQLADDRYKKITAGETGIALALAAQIDARKQLSAELDAELEMIRQKNREFDAQDARLKSLVASTDIGKNQQTMADEALAESALNSGKIDLSTYDQIIAKLHEVKDEGKDAFKSLEDAINGWGKNAAAAIVDFAMTGKSSFSDMANSIIQDMMRMVVQENITGPMAKAFGGFIKGIIPSADGNVFNSPGLSAYSGQIVSKPTFFPFASGVGLMGEAGPEAILPLKRGSDGKLGVTAAGSSAAPINVSVSVDASGSSVQSNAGGGAELGRRIGAAVRQILVQEKRNGGLLA